MFDNAGLTLIILPSVITVHNIKPVSIVGIVCKRLFLLSRCSYFCFCFFFSVIIFTLFPPTDFSANWSSFLGLAFKLMRAKSCLTMSSSLVSMASSVSSGPSPWTKPT